VVGNIRRKREGENHMMVRNEAGEVKRAKIIQVFTAHFSAQDKLHPNCFFFFGK
jgi:hypothetical protein